MAEYHVGCGPLGIYAGTLNQNKTTWRNKNNVTEEAILAVVQYLLSGEGSCAILDKGKAKYRLKVEEVNENE